MKVGILCAGDREVAPFISIRTITDTSSYSGVDEFERNCDIAAQISANIVRCMLRGLL